MAENKAKKPARVKWLHDIIRNRPEFARHRNFALSDCQRFSLLEVTRVRKIRAFRDDKMSNVIKSRTGLKIKVRPVAEIAKFYFHKNELQLRDRNRLKFLRRRFKNYLISVFSFGSATKYIMGI